MHISDRLSKQLLRNPAYSSTMGCIENALAHILSNAGNRSFFRPIIYSHKHFRLIFKSSKKFKTKKPKVKIEKSRKSKKKDVPTLNNSVRKRKKCCVDKEDCSEGVNKIPLPPWLCPATSERLYIFFQSGDWPSRNMIHLTVLLTVEDPDWYWPDPTLE